MGDFSQWYFADMPRFIIRAGRGYLRQVYFGFSLPILVRTLFAPWKRDVRSAENLSLSERAGVAIENVLSRLIGASVRVATIVTGSIALLLISLGTFIIGIIWMILPFVTLIILGLGTNLVIFGGGQ